MPSVLAGTDGFASGDLSDLSPFCLDSLVCKPDFFYAYLGEWLSELSLRCG